MVRFDLKVIVDMKMLAIKQGVESVSSACGSEIVSIIIGTISLIIQIINSICHVIYIQYGAKVSHN